MANKGVNTGFAKCFILFMAIVILVQGAAYLGLAIWGSIMMRCSDEAINVSEKPFDFAIDLIYFRDESCGDPTVTVSLVEGSYPIEMDWSKSEVITHRMSIFLITYEVVGALWVVTSLLVMVTLCGRVTKAVMAICFWPWFLSVIAGSVLDAVATGYFIKDITETTSANETLTYIGAQTDEYVLQYLQTFDSYFMVPAIVMACISSRVVLIWLLNIFGASFCLSLSQVLSKQSASYRDKDRISDTSTATPGAQPALHNPVILTRQEAGAQPPHSPPPTLQTQQSQLRSVEPQQQPPQIAPKPLVIRVEQTPPAQSPTPTTTASVYPVIPVTPGPQQSAQSPAESSNDGATYRNTDTHPDRLNYPSTQPTAPSPQLSVQSPLNNRYSNADPFANQRVSDELRNQMPWSYTSMLGPQKPLPPRKPQTQAQVFDNMPAPDYDMQPNADEASSNPQAHQAYSRW